MEKRKLITSAFAVLSSAFVATQAMASLAPHVPGELIVKFKDTDQKSLMNLKSYGAELARTIELSAETLHVVKVDYSKSLDSTINSLLSDPNVVYAEPNFIYTIVHPIAPTPVENFLASLAPAPLELNYTPNDPQFGRLWGLRNTGDNEPNGRVAGVAGADIKAIQAWDLTRGSRDVTIAVIDTGIDYRHEDLRDNMWVNPDPNAEDVHGYNFVNNTGNPWDGNGHGTHCAGTIGAIHNNALGVAGVMADVSLVAVKFLSDAGSGTTENAIRAVDYATRLNVDIMSNSWGGGGRSQALEDAISRANDAGILFIAASGNSGTNNDTRPHYPSNYNLPNVISVAATTAQDTLASFSTFGRNTVHIAAPGHNVLSSIQNNRYAVFSGTSMAAPHVSGALGLLLAQEGRMPIEEARERLLATTDPLASLRGRTVNGGRLNAHNLLTDTRPVRNEPNPDNWEVVMLDDVWETEHPYAHNMNETRSFNIPGARYMRLHIVRYDTEVRHDYIAVRNAQGQIVEQISGVGADYTSDYVEGDTMSVQFVTDRSVARWGFLIDRIEVQYE
jgi:thermitase